jgi:hypothetical protein
MLVWGCKLEMYISYPVGIERVCTKLDLKEVELKHESECNQLINGIKNNMCVKLKPSKN